MLRPEVGDYVVFKSLEEIIRNQVLKGEGIYIHDYYLKVLYENDGSKFKVTEVRDQDGAFKIKEVRGFILLENTIEKIIKKEETKPEFKFGEKILVRDNEKQEWKEAIFCHYRSGGTYHYQVVFEDLRIDSFEFAKKTSIEVGDMVEVSHLLGPYNGVVVDIDYEEEYGVRIYNSKGDFFINFPHNSCTKI